MWGNNQGYMNQWDQSSGGWNDNNGWGNNFGPNCNYGPNYGGQMNGGYGGGNNCGGFNGGNCGYGGPGYGGPGFGGPGFGGPGYGPGPYSQPQYGNMGGGNNSGFHIPDHFDYKEKLFTTGKDMKLEVNGNKFGFIDHKAFSYGKNFELLDNNNRVIARAQE